ncbi:MAG: 16S rRNA (cytidine(1402)-2'-O)-methyltransferase [Anaerolineales bacterium]
MSTLYLVATPIGNLEDITLRALRILRSVPLIAAEDTRQTRKLLTHYEITTPLTSYHEHNKAHKTAELVRQLAAGDLALVSDAGTPVINDPGYELVQAALQAGHTVVPIPGPSAPLAALIAAGLPADAFLYLGYLPRRAAERRTLLQQVAALPYTLIFLETPHRLLDALGDLRAELGNRNMAAARELTKLHEEIWRGSLDEARTRFETTPPKGELTLVVAGHTPPQGARWPVDVLRAEISAALSRGEAPSRLARRLAGQSGWPRREIYTLLTNVSPSDDPPGESSDQP